MVGDVVLFQVSLTAAARAKKIRSELTIDDEWYEAILDTLDLVDRHAGSIMAMARVGGEVFREDGGELWGSRYYAPISDLYCVYFPEPVNSPSKFSEWPEFLSHGPVQYRQFSSDERYREPNTLIEEGNDDIPEWATERPLTSLWGCGGSQC